MRYPALFLAFAAALPLAGPRPACADILLPGSAPGGRYREVVLFGFDDRAFPFRNHVETHLHAATNPRIVLPEGPAGSWDEVLHYYGTVLRVDGGLRLWYNGNYGPPKPDSPAVERAHYCLCYATSKDGIHWEKPDLGLAEYRGSRHNNIVDFPDPDLMSTAAILYDPSAEPARRYKMAYEGGPKKSVFFRVAFSPDGLHWTLSPLNPVGGFLEMAGVAEIGGLYYVYGQNGASSWHARAARRLAAYVSADFEHWSPCGAVGLDRSSDVTGPSLEDGSRQMEEVHLGAAIWDRGNVFLGIYGQWHSHFSGERRLVAMDLGLALTHDGLHFSEPIPGFRFVPAREQPGAPIGMEPALIQGQGMENIGEQTLYWYSLWRGYGSTGVSMVSWPRDRLGDLAPFSPNQPEAVSCPILAEKEGAKVFINAGGLGTRARLHLRLLDEGFRPLAGYEGEISSDGLRIPVAWKSASALPPGQKVRLEVRFEGDRPEDARLYAAYVLE